MAYTGKRVEGVYYKIVSRDGNSGLGHNEDTFDKAVEQVLGLEKSVEEKGYKREKWLIVKVEWGRSWFANGLFAGEWSKSESVAGINEKGEIEWRKE